MADPDRYGAAMDPKTSLQELAARAALAPPVYVVTPKARSQSRVHRDGDRRRGDATGVGSSKKQAEMAGALAVWRTLSDRA
jgi:ribonuclease-3